MRLRFLEAFQSQGVDLGRCLEQRKGLKRMEGG